MGKSRPRPSCLFRTPSKLERLLARDGADCWFCGLPMAPGQATIEHHLSKSLGGTNALENLRLCHPGCNRHLANWPIEKKLKVRDKRQRHLARQQASAT